MSEPESIDVIHSAAASEDAAPRRRRRSPKGEAARANILEVARAAFAERGYRGSSINEIAKSAGMSMPGLLHHFENKDALFAAVMRQHDLRDEDFFDTELLGSVGGFASAGAFDVLDGFVATARINRDRRTFVRLSHLNAAESSSGDHPGAAASLEHFRKSRAFVAAALRRSIERGEVLPGTDVDVVAAQVVGMVEGLENQWLHEGDDFDFAEIYAVWIEELKQRIRA